MKHWIALSLTAALLAGAAQAKPVTRTSTFDGPKVSSGKTTVRDKQAGTLSSDRVSTRKSDGAVATSSRDRQRTDTGVTGSGSRTGYSGNSSSYEYERIRTDDGWTTSGSGTGPQGGDYSYEGTGTRTENGREADRSLSRNGTEVYHRTDSVQRDNGSVSRDTSVTRKQRRHKN